LAAAIKRSLGVSGPTVSSHLTALEELLVVERHRDGTVSLTDSEALALILQGARRFSKAALTQAAHEESADHYLAQRRIGRRRRQVAGAHDYEHQGWVESGAPALGAEIARLVAAGSWFEDPPSYWPTDAERKAAPWPTDAGSL
jgi:DNA-binding transcriptional ArsR family regulator